jgi:hypothetical protein
LFKCTLCNHFVCCLNRRDRVMHRFQVGGVLALDVAVYLLLCLLFMYLFIVVYVFVYNWLCICLQMFMHLSVVVSLLSFDVQFCC